MAEGIQLETCNTKYFCHRCSREVGPFCADELVCPGCSSEFLEEVSHKLYETENLPDLGYDYRQESENDTDYDDLMPDLGMEHLISQMLLNVADNIPPDAPTRPESPEPGEILGFQDFISGLRNSHLSESHARPRGFSDFIDLVVDEEIDALTSRLLDEVEVSGPPPLAKEQIKSLPFVKMAQEHTDKGIQCTVCMEDLRLHERAKQLPCNHFYHEKCITPWLEKQATCPNCRETVQVEIKGKETRRDADHSSRSSHNRDRRYLLRPPDFTSLFPTSMNPFRYIN